MAMIGTYHMSALLETLSDIYHIHNEQHLFTFVLNKCSDVLRAQGGTIFTFKEETGDLFPEAVKGVSLTLIREIPFKAKLGIAGWVASNQTAALIENAQNDERFNRAVDVITGVRTRSVQRGGKIWIRIFPQKAISRKSPEVPMGSGKGAVEFYAAEVKPGTMIFEMDGLPEAQAREALRLASHKLPVRTKFVARIRQ